MNLNTDIQKIIKVYVYGYDEHTTVFNHIRYVRAMGGFKKLNHMYTCIFDNIQGNVFTQDVVNEILHNFA